MPKVIEESGYQIVIYSNDHIPPHVHAVKDGKSASFTLTPVALLSNAGLSEKQIIEAVDIIRRHKGQCWKIWHEVHG